MLISKTTNHDQFKTVLGNRKIFKPHVNELVSSIERRNLLQFNPIQVTKAMYIIDGQHRLEAAKILGVPIFYIIMNDGDLEDIKLLQTQRMWTTSDYLQSYIALNKPEYVALEEFAKEYQISIPYATLIATGQFVQPSLILKLFRRGEFRFNDKTRAENMASHINEMKQYCTDNAWKDRFFLIALANCMNKIDMKQLFHKLETFSLAITRRANTRDYVRQFEDIYNFKQRAESYIRL